MNVINVRGNKLGLVVGWIGTILFAAGLIFGLMLGMAEHDVTLIICALLFGGFLLLSLFLLLDYYRRRLLLGKTQITPLCLGEKEFSHILKLM